MTRNDIERLAGAINTLRPDWPIEQLVAFLTKHAPNRPLWDAARVLVWIATEPGQIDGQHIHQDPGAFLKPGPWWDAITITDTTPTPVGWCSLHRCEDSTANPCRLCRQDRAQAVTDPELITSAIAAVRANIRPTTNALHPPQPDTAEPEETPHADA